MKRYYPKVLLSIIMGVLVQIAPKVQLPALSQ
jgi:hypothetical protein